jgi:hypothetical protein
MTIQIVDDFLTPLEHKVIYDHLMGEDTAWFYSDGLDYPGDGNFQFVHFYHWNHEWRADISYLQPILDKLNPYAICKIKANLLTPTKEVKVNGWHVDVESNKFTTCIYYVNDNDGYTEFEDGTKVESKANRLVMFNSALKHRGTTSTEKRVVLNLNFVLDDNFHL